MAVNVSDVRSNPNDQIAHAAKVIGRSADRARVFRAICYGKQRIKTVEDIHKKTRLSRKRVLEEAKKLVNNHIIKQTKCDGDTAYEKDSFYCLQQKKILSLAQNRKKLASFPTKTNPRLNTAKIISIQIPRQRINIRQITIDDIDSFSKVKKKRNYGMSPTKIYETKFKRGVKKIIGEKGQFKDWGGEKNDLWSTRLVLKGRRYPAAFAFKGPGKKGKLTPKAMGKNGDQIQRLFQSQADIFLVQYWDQIDESVVHQMAEFAKAKSVSEGKRIQYGVIDGQDSTRLVTAYPKAFK